MTVRAYSHMESWMVGAALSLSLYMVRVRWRLQPRALAMVPAATCVYEHSSEQMHHQSGVPTSESNAGIAMYACLHESIT